MTTLDLSTITTRQFRDTYRRVRPMIVGRATYYPVQKIWTKPHGGPNVTREYVMKVTGLTLDEVLVFEERQHVEL